MILDQKSSGSKPDRTTGNQSLTIRFVGDFLYCLVYKTFRKDSLKKFYDV